MPYDKEGRPGTEGKAHRPARGGKMEEWEVPIVYPLCLSGYDKLTGDILGRSCSASRKLPFGARMKKCLLFKLKMPPYLFEVLCYGREFHARTHPRRMRYLGMDIELDESRTGDRSFSVVPA